MDNLNKEILQIYDYISQIQSDIADLAKDVAAESVVNYDEIKGTPENLSDFNNDQHFVTSETLEQKISEIPEIDDTLYLRTRGVDNQECLVPTKFNVITTKTQDEEDDSDNVATTSFVHSLLKKNKLELDDTISIVLRQQEQQKGDYATKEDVTNIVSNILVNYDRSTIVDAKIQAALQTINVPTKTSQLTNDSGFITIDDIPEVETGVISINGQSGVVTLDIPTKTSELINDSGFLTEAPVTSVNGRTGAVTVVENVQANWNATSGDAAILNKPALKRVATTGSYEDLQDTPDLSIYATENYVNNKLSATITYEVIAVVPDRIIS